MIIIYLLLLLNFILFFTIQKLINIFEINKIMIILMMIILNILMDIMLI